MTARPARSTNHHNAPQDISGVRLLVRAVEDLSLARNIETIQRIVRTAARKLTGSDGSTFVLRDGDFCHYVDEDAISPLWKGKKFPLEMCISGWVMLNRKSVTIEDIYKDPRIPADAYRPTFVKSLAMVPIRTSSPIGAIGNYWASPHTPTQEEMTLLEALADTTSVAMENVRVYDELEDRVRQRTAELEKANREIERLSLCDELTGLYNRRGFYLLAEQEYKRARRTGHKPVEVFIDVDGLKQVNDRNGHEAGDRLIRDAANIIRKAFRVSDIAGRVGGDEFCILALDANPEGVHRRLQEEIDAFNNAHPATPLSMSVGAVSPEENSDEALESLISRADDLMYREKKIRKNHALNGQPVTG